MSHPESSVSVSVSIGDVKVQFSGSAEAVLASVINYLSKQIPNLDLARRISLTYSTPELLDTFSRMIKLTPEGPRVIPEPGVNLSDKDVVGLQLVGSRISKELGKQSDDSMQVADIQSATALNPKSISSRISEMVKAGHVVRDENEAGRYRITTAGVHWLTSTIAKKVKSA